MAREKRKQHRSHFRPPAKCFFCTSEQKPDYKEVEVLSRFLSDRGKILPRSRSGICAKHQRRLAQAIKRARHLALVPFAAQI